ncbi:diguanylate cyclase domain-containing protein [Arboricoccus pini]|nr:diguanylate cyclase [Arboricoccus pini]
MTLENLGFCGPKAVLGEREQRQWPLNGARFIEVLRQEATARLAAQRGHRVLLLQAEHEIGLRTRRGLQEPNMRAPLEVDIVTTTEGAIRALGQDQYDVCILDWPAESPEQPPAILAAIERMGIILPVIGLSRRGASAAEAEALQLGIADVIDLEDLDARRLERAIRMSAHRQRTTLHLDRMAHLDPLTGLGNRTFLHDRLAHAIGQAKLHRGEIAVMMLDLNGFKAINDEMGHAAGDELLRAIGERFKARLRVGDTIARPGDDEFAFVIEGLGSASDARAAARKLLAAVEAPFVIDGQEVRVGASLGAARFPVVSDDAATLLRLADGAMYTAKMERTREPRFHASIEKAFGVPRGSSNSPLATMLREDLIALRFEPQTPLASDRVGISVVLQTPESVPDFGTGSLNALTEQAGMGELLTNWLLERICLQARAWQKIYPTPFHMSLPILSRRQLLWPDLAPTIQDQLQRHGLPRAMLEIEIDERLLQKQLTAGGVLHELRRAGMRLAVTDFGRTLGALRLLQEAPVQTLKLSAVLTNPMTREERATRLTRGLLHLAHDMRLRVVADGATTREQLTFLHGIGCDAVQRTPLTRQLTVQECTAWLDENLRPPLRATFR